MKEEWRAITDYDNYEISSFGNVRNINKNKKNYKTFFK
jgi:hypothetical protein